MQRSTRVGVGALPLVLILLAGAAPASAQTGSATLTGTVIDNVGVVPGAMVTATQAGTNVPRSATTNEQGIFRLLALPPGRYTLKIEMDGFRPINVPEFNLLGGETRELGRLTLTAGNVTESVTITAEVTPVQTATSALTKNITGDTLVSVQVKGRDIFGMMKILPGVVDNNMNRDFAQWNSGRNLSINGGDSLNKNTTIDGVPVGEEGGSGTTHITPNIDAIGEVNVITSGYTAENGRQSSGLISIVTKSGTNQFRGSGWYNARRDEWNANSFFNMKEGRAKPFFEVNISGYSFGGPVIIPKLFDSRTSQKKTYFFISQEFTDDLRPTSVSRTNLPTALERAGDFSQTLLTTGASTASANGIMQTIIDPNTLQPFANNRIPADRWHPMGRALLNLLPEPNMVLNPIEADRFSSNDARDQTPLHERQNFVMRIDQVINQNNRFSVKLLTDRDHSTTFNRVVPGDFVPGSGVINNSVNNLFPGNLITGAYSQVLGPTLVNEVTVGMSQNHWGFIVGTDPGNLNPDDYRVLYRQNVINQFTGQPFGDTIPRLEPLGPYRDPPALSREHLDEYPYMPTLQFSGGDRGGLGSYSPTSHPIPRWNENYRYTLQDDLSWTKGRHNLKFGVFFERDSKTEPGSANYAGTYNFGHNTDNPLSTGNGYANALLGVFTTYSELNDRLDRENRHWQSDAYVQDSWRINSRMTLDYGLRVSHLGAMYESRNMNSGFDDRLWDPNQAATLYRPHCANTPDYVGTQPCSTANRKAINPLTGEIVSQAYAGNTVPGSGSITNGMWRNGIAHHPTNPDTSKKDGWYYDMPMLSWGPRVGFAWDVFGDGKTAIRASGGVFYNFINRSQYDFNGGAMISRTRTVRNDSIDSVTALAAAGTQFAESPQGSALVEGRPITLYGNQIPQTDFQPETNYQANVAFQRDIGFNTVAEIAYVTNIGRHNFRTKDTNNIPLVQADGSVVYPYADPANLFRNEPISANFLRRDYPGMGSISYLTTDELALNYNSMQLSIQRRLSRGLQMGVAYTLAKGEGLRGWDFATEELYGEQGLRDRYYGPTNVDRRHILVVNYSYQIPNPTPNIPILTHVLRNWEASGVTQYTTGVGFDPTCNTNQGGVGNSDPSLTGIGTRCELTGEPIDVYTPDPSLPIEDQLHFNPAAFKRPVPNGAVGNFGDAPTGLLRHPAWWNWDFTLARRIPVNIGRGGSVRLQVQFYNLFNQVEFTTMNGSQTFTTNQGTVNNSANTGKYTATTNPFNGGITLRFDY